MSQAQEETTATPGSNDRAAQFRSDVADMRLRDPRAGRDRVLMFTGGVLMALGIALAIIAYFYSSGADAAYNTQGPAEQRDAIVIGLAGVTVAVVGGAMFLRYSLAQFLRFWLARLIYEQQTQTDRIVNK
jgi:hypothetical protein